MKSESENVSHSVTFNSLQLHGLELARLLCLCNSSGKNTGVGCLSLLQGNLSNRGTEPGSPILQEDSLLSVSPGKPWS